jgi:hypothetical protein
MKLRVVTFSSLCDKLSWCNTETDLYKSQSVAGLDNFPINVRISKFSSSTTSGVAQHLANNLMTVSEPEK